VDMRRVDFLGGVILGRGWFLWVLGRDVRVVFVGD
jgi:hypothetical protein